MAEATSRANPAKPPRFAAFSIRGHMPIQPPRGRGARLVGGAGPVSGSAAGAAFGNAPD